MCEPLLILLDEPFTGIDPITIAEIRQIILELRNEGIGILLTDHNVHEALKITTRSYLIKDGKVRTQGTPTQIVRDPIAIAEYLGAGFSDNSYRGPSEQVRADDADAFRAFRQARPAPTAKPAPRRNLTPKTLEFAATQKMSPTQMILEQEKISKLVEQLKSDNPKSATEELVKKGLACVPVAALRAGTARRGTAAARRRCAGSDSQASDAVRRVRAGSARKTQLAALRDLFERKAG